MALAAFCGVLHAQSPIIILDPGHDPIFPGARAVCGEFEYLYNDRIVTAFLQTTKAHVLPTREPGKPPALSTFQQLRDRPGRSGYTLRSSLQARVDWAKVNKGDLFISIHHDSVAERFIQPDKTLCGGKGGHALIPTFRKKHTIGFNVFIYQDETHPHYRQSLRFAKLLGRELLAIGRMPSSYHYFPEDDCRSCRPVARELGVWHQQLYVLREAQMPAVLIEVGNIVDVEDEARINTDAFRLEFARALDRALALYFSADTAPD